MMEGKPVVRWGAGPVRLRCRISSRQSTASDPGGEPSFVADVAHVEFGPERAEYASRDGDPRSAAGALVGMVRDEIVELHLAGLRVVTLPVLQARHPMIDAVVDTGGSAPCQDPAAFAPGMSPIAPAVAVLTYADGRSLEGWLGLSPSLFRDVEAVLATAEDLHIRLRGNGGFHTFTPAGQIPRQIVLRPDESIAVRFHHTALGGASTP